MLLNRKLQNSILHIAASCYPTSANHELNEIYEPLEEKELAANLKYLEQNRLIEKGSVQISLDGFYSFGGVTITNIGMDFLADDGGLSAILGVVTIKFETDTLKAILENRINQSDLPQEQKRAMNLALDELPAEGIKHLTTKLLDEGLENLPSALILISTYLGLS
ncbi:hypothetical protein [Acinetobacter sp. NIPH 2100]|uniref:hypothetical protein n=1 Tax=Acinetobacter sp. NIPH 2100 TaxID=1217708 RepID=UPI0002CEFE93|nr:hypothetical protein [Acinetobacter sp. NIPH 2100]ENX41531.1 hypothetical protein F887_01927 [Acinetobacter sp. NIPH 2100]